MLSAIIASMVVTKNQPKPRCLRAAKATSFRRFAVLVVTGEWEGNFKGADREETEENYRIFHSCANNGRAPADGKTPTRGVSRFTLRHAFGSKTCSYTMKGETPMNRAKNLTLSLVLLTGLTAGCATQRTTTQEVAYDRRTGEPVTVERQTTTTTDSSGDTGVLSGTVNVIGEVIALPFRAVGGLFRAIF
jgi:hypothetical protein